jgi:hypothetical protein
MFHVKHSWAREIGRRCFSFSGELRQISALFEFYGSKPIDVALVPPKEPNGLYPSGFTVQSHLKTARARQRKLRASSFGLLFNAN